MCKLCVRDKSYFTLYSALCVTISYYSNKLQCWNKLSSIRLLKTISLLMQTKIFYPAHPAFLSQPPLTAKTLHWSQINTMLLEQKFPYLRELEKLHFTYQDNSSTISFPVCLKQSLLYTPRCLSAIPSSTVIYWSETEQFLTIRVQETSRVEKTCPALVFPFP